MRRLADAEQRVRAFANRREVFDLHFASRGDDWNRLCVAMDTLGDSAAALMHFESHGLGSEVDERYLRLYGAFQAIILQQDAIKAIYDVYIGSKLKAPQDSGWQKCRTLRNLAAGHPVDHKQGEFQVFLSRITITDDGFDLLIAQKGQRELRAEYVDFRTPYKAYKEEALAFLTQVEAAQESLEGSLGEFAR